MQKIWLDTAESPDEHAVPYEGYDESTILGDIRIACDFLARSLTSKDALPGLLNIGSMAVGTPEQCRRIVDVYEQAGADQLILYVELPFLTHPQIMKSIRLFGEQVIRPYKGARGITSEADRVGV